MRFRAFTRVSAPQADDLDSVCVYMCVHMLTSRVLRDRPEHLLQGHQSRTPFTKQECEEFMRTLAAFTGEHSANVHRPPPKKNHLLNVKSDSASRGRRRDAPPVVHRIRSPHPPRRLYVTPLPSPPRPAHIPTHPPSLTRSLPQTRSAEKNTAASSPAPSSRNAPSTAPRGARRPRTRCNGGGGGGRRTCSHS